MRTQSFSFIAAALMFAVCVGGMLCPRPLWGDSLRLLTDLEYEVTDHTTTTKETGLTSKTDKSEFSQLYNLDVMKELLPTLILSAGGVYEYNSMNTEINGIDSDNNDRAIRPYIDLQLSTPMLRAATSYRKSELKESGSGREMSRRYTEEYSGSLSWKPVELPEVDLYFTRNLGHNDPTSTEEKIDNVSDIYQLSSRYTYQRFRFDYNHTTTDSRNKVSEFETLNNSDNGTIRYNNSFKQGKFTLNGSARIRREQVEFSGSGDRRVSTASVGVIIGKEEDPTPLISDPDDGFVLDSIDLLVDSPLNAKQLSFGLDFDSPTELDTLLISFTELGNIDSSDFSWDIYVRDNETESWSQITPVQDNSEFTEGLFRLSFASVDARYIKIVTTPLVLLGENLLISDLTAQRTLPPDTSEFISTDWSTDLRLNWKMSDKTTSGYNILYREERTQPFNEKRTLLSTGARLTHRFNDIFIGNMRLLRSETRERDEADSIGYTFSSSLAGKYLDTFDQSLTYSFTHQHDDEEGTGISNALLLRNNLALYDGWSMNFDSGYSWQDPSEGESSTLTFVRVGSSIIPNQWMNFNLFYEMTWNKTVDKPLEREQTGRLVANWVPWTSLSLTADVSMTNETGDNADSSTRQQYFVNWAPFRDGSLQFSFSYGLIDDSDGEKTWTLSPSVRWQVNKKTMLTLNYSLGEREDQVERTEFEAIRLALRFFY